MMKLKSTKSMLLVLLRKEHRENLESIKHFDLSAAEALINIEKFEKSFGEWLIEEGYAEK